MRNAITFCEQSTDAHVAARPRVLQAQSWFPAPPGITEFDILVADLIERLDLIHQRIETSGLAYVRTERRLTNDEFLELGRRLGRLIPEHAEAVQPFVENEYILNLVIQKPATSDADVQPFAENPITLHTESSLRCLADQPRYLVFACVAAPEPGYGGQTILVPMSSVLQRLSERDRLVLRCTRLGLDDTRAPILHVRDDRDAFSFRDFGDTPMTLRCAAAAHEVSDGDVRSAIAALLAALYQPAAIGGVHWKENLIVVLDNARFFHGRLYGRGGPQATRRHLKRLRIRAA
jgi:alpha-ketoglutarate-dependent taurine dioxygenase